MDDFQPNQLHRELLSVCGLNPWHQHISSARIAMYSSHIGQALTINGATERNFQTGMEAEFGKYTFNVKMPCDGKIVKIIERYRPDFSENSIKENPETIVIYEDVDTKVLGYFKLTTFCSNHQYFGFRYKTKDGIRKLRPEQFIEKDTVFLDSPSVEDDGGYKYGIQANVAMMTHPAVAEDGILISEDFAKKLQFYTYETRTIEWGSEEFALNLYGTVDNYKAFPDIGDEIRPDGILVALRSCEPSIMAGVEQNIYDTMRVDHTFDNVVYANGPGGIVKDIKVHHDLNNSNFSEKNMDKQVQKYDSVRRIFYQQIVDFWNKMVKLRGNALHMTPALHNLIREAITVVSEGVGHQRVTKLYRRAPLDVYRVEIVIEYLNTPGIGYKLTGCAGDKGVICQVEPTWKMPVDEEGNVADVVMDGASTINRMNPGRLYEQYFNTASRHTHNLICKMLGVKPYENPIVANNHLNKLDADLIKSAIQTLCGYYNMYYPDMVKWVDEKEESDVDFLTVIVCNGIKIYLPPENPKESVQIVKDIESSIYRPHFGKVSYVGNSGKRVTTKDNIRIGSMYLMLLEKTGDDWSSVSSCKLQHLGVIAPLTKQDKYSKPARLQGVKGAGEAEVRIFSSYTKGNFTIEMLDRNNNPKTHKHVVKGLLNSENPSNIKNLVDRNQIPYGRHKALSLVKHIGECAGFRFRYAPFNPNLASGMIETDETD